MSKKQKTALGLDIGSYSVKLLEITRQADQYSVSAIRSEKILGSDKAAAISAIKGMVGAANIASAPLGVSISGPNVVVRAITLPSMTSDELRSSLVFEAEKHIPFKISDMHLDFKILSSGLPENKMKVLLVGAKKETVENVISIAEGAGLSPAFVDVDGFAVVNALEFSGVAQEGQNKTCAVLNIGHKLTNITVMSDFVPFFLRDISIAGADMIVSVKGELGVSFEESENLLKNPGENSTNVQAAMRPVLERLAGEIRASFDYCESQAEIVIEKIFFSGGCAKFANFAKALQEALGMEVMAWDPLGKLAIPAQLKDKADTLTGEMAVAAGLCIRGIK